MVVVSGLPGSGKSYFSRRLAEQMPLLVVQSDSLRRTLFPKPTYSREESARLFAACYELVEEELRRGASVLIDATNLVEDHRERLYNIADQLEVKLVLVWIEAPPEVVFQRLQSRCAGMDPQDHSTADWEVYRRMKSTAEPIRRNHYVVDTSRDIAPAVAKVVRELRRWMRRPA